MHLYRRIITGFLCLFFMIGIDAQEYRAGVAYKHDIFKWMDADINYEVRSLQKDKNYINCMVQTGISAELLDGLSLGTTLRYLIGDNDDADDEYTGDYSSKWRFTGDIKYKAKRFDNDVCISQRLRFQHIQENADNESEYLRYKVTFNYRLTKKVLPYVAVEPYYSFEKDRLKALRIETGSKFEIFKNELELFFIAEALNKKNGLKSNYIMGVAYRF